ncbi:DUF6060 domain-containing protein [Niallia sp. 01092]|uniref:DUF6060 domain-containing protein n=1 Tax=unclassified Niallia TaxID=2837522 RepID=UPI003FCF0159
MKSKKFAVLLTALALGISLSFGTASKGYAAEEEQNINLSQPNVEKFYDEELGAEITPFKTTENGLVPVSEEEYKESTNLTEKEDLANEFISTDKTPQDPTITPYADVDLRTWVYKESSATKYYGNPIKVSASIDCTTSSCRVDKQWQATVSKSYSVSASSEIKAIDTGASFSLTSAKSSSSTYSFTINKGQAGYIVFKPYKRKSTGTLTQYSTVYGKIKSKSGYARSAIKLRTGEADG